MIIEKVAHETEHVALLDLDGTLADYDTSMRTKLEALRSPGEPELGDDFHDGPEWLQNRRALIKNAPGFWRDLQRINRGFEVLEVLRQLKFELMVLTKGPSRATSAWTEKVLWCQEHLPDVKVTVTEDKGLVYGRVLFDDWPPYFLRWLKWRPRGLVIMLDHPHNRGFEHPNVFRYRTCEQDHLELTERLRQARQRP
jgi:5'-nucleotidase